MKPLSELRTVLNFYPHELNSAIQYFAKQDIDWDVFLESIGTNLQRGYVWSIDQKRELIWSVLMRRHIPRMAFVFTVDDVYKIIDGKQRLSTMIDYYKGKFTLLYDGSEYFFNDLPLEHRRHIERYHFAYLVYNEEFDNPLKDQQLIDWFRFINFAGTPQDIKHIEKLTNGAGS